MEQKKQENPEAVEYAEDASPEGDDHIGHEADINIGLLVTLLLAGSIFLVTLLFTVAGFFNYMAYQERLDKVVNRPYDVSSKIQDQLVQLTQRAEIPISQAMPLIVEKYETPQGAGPLEH